MLKQRYMRAAVFVLVVGAASAAPEEETSPVFRDFQKSVQEYLKMKKEVPRLRTTKDSKEIVGRRHALARKIKEMRAGAKQGDLFTPAVTEEFRALIRTAFQGTNAPNVRKTIRQGEPVPNWKPTVNGDYPENLPITTVPPTLLKRIPELPQGVAYRIVGRDLVLQDTEARVVLDFITGALP